ncbi:MAG: hypothetical protein ACLUOF_09840 [Ruminococcus sp.]
MQTINLEDGTVNVMISMFGREGCSITAEQVIRRRPMRECARSTISAV